MSSCTTPAAFAISKKTTSPSRSRSWKNSTASRRGTTTSTSRPASSSAVSTSITGDVLSEQGAALGPGLGSIRVVLGGELEQQLKAAFLERRPRSSHPQHGLAAGAAGVAPPGRAGHQGHEPADEGQGPGRDRAGLHQRQGGERRHALLRQADRGEHAQRGDRRLLQREPRGGPREPAAGRRAEGQRELHPPQRLEIGAGRLSARAATPS